jgi:starch synthase
MRVLFVSSEIYPYAKTGGLADVAGALPKALTDKGVEVVSVMPLFASVEREKHGLEKCDISFDIVLNHHIYPCNVFRKDNVYFIENAGLFERSLMYGEYADNGIRFGVFAYAVMELALRLHSSWDVIHLNDWQSALVAYLAKIRYKMAAKVILTIHNLAFQGVFPKKLMNDLEIGWDVFTLHRFEFYDQVNFLKGAIAYSDRVVAASPRYAREIQSVEFGCDLDPFLRDNSYKLSGILNGIDNAEFNPAKDPYLYKKYGDVLSENKRDNKLKLLEELGLKHPERPLFVFIGRFAWQKGIGTILEALSSMQALEINVVILGSGERYYNDSFTSLAGVYYNVAVRLGYDERLARMIYSAGDFLLMPSVYEPCGLNQMIAMAYGCVPIVRATGGLANSVEDLSTETFLPEKGTGIVFENLDRFSFLLALSRALALFSNPKRFQAIISHNQNVDNTWATRAEAYLTLYQEGDKL